MKLERGKFISLKLLEAIEESRTAIIIFSKNYASSTWCLEELTKIMERADKKGQEAIPVFYNIEPSDVRMHRNSFAKVLAKHEADLKGTDLEKVQRWKDALNKEANIAGWDVRKTANGNEAECINENFQNIQCTVSATEKYLVGIESRVGGVEELLKVGSGGVSFVGIWAWEAWGRQLLQEKYLTGFLINFKGLVFLKKKVLIVFDDENQLENLIGMPDLFGDGSRIILTTRDSELFRKHNQLYPVPELPKREALELFSLHAFQKPILDKEFLKLSKCVVDYAKGLLLALKVLGSFLYKRSINEWRSTFVRLKSTGNKDVVEQLSLNLDGLTLEDKNIFLDIACFLEEKGKIM
uniref:TMV resistance protein N-like n=1 Tax=Nicotiana sylvestris TaxID=4096 RepID=A0A1U7WWX6_NICSY|nr:PREDICTED: TMV resistance protein N-like [Nicotiana sylvestris]